MEVDRSVAWFEENGLNLHGTKCVTPAEMFAIFGDMLFSADLESSESEYSTAESFDETVEKEREKEKEDDESVEKEKEVEQNAAEAISRIGDLSSIHEGSTSSKEDSAVKLDLRKKPTKARGSGAAKRASPKQKSVAKTAGRSGVGKKAAIEQGGKNAAADAASKRKLFNPDCEQTLSDLDQEGTATSTFEITPRPGAAATAQRTAHLLAKLAITTEGGKRQRNAAGPITDTRRRKGESLKRPAADPLSSSTDNSPSKSKKQPASGPATAAGRRKVAKMGAEGKEAAEFVVDSEEASELDDDEDNNYGPRGVRKRAVDARPHSSKRALAARGAKGAR